MSTYKKGDPVRQIVPVIEGLVAGFQIDQETGDRLILVEYADADGNGSSRYFREAEIELKPADAEAETAPAEPAQPSAEEGAASAE